MLTKQVLDQNYEQKKCYKLCDNNNIKVCATNRAADSAYRWDYANCSNVLSVMSVPPSPNGSTSSIISSEDSSSNLFGFPAVRSALPQQYPLLSQPSTSSAFSFGSSANKQIKLCRVCGDRAKSYHFGGISCDSCKAFFRRSVQNDAYRNFHCPYERHCDITINSRKSCQYCRFNKCLTIGMEKSWVMTEEERMQMLKNRIEKRKQEEGVCVKTLVKQTQFYGSESKYRPDITQIFTFLTEEEVKLIENLVNLHLECSKEISFSISPDQSKPSRTDILNIFFTAIQQFALFAQRFESFTCISTQDKQILLRDGVLELCFLRGAFSYDIKGKQWRYDSDHSSGVIYSDNLEIMVTKDLLEKHMHFIKTLKRLHLDEPTYILLVLIVLLSSDREALSNSEVVQTEQEKYLILLKSYLNWRYGTQTSSVLYPNLLLKLTDLRELAEAHTDYQLLLGRQELEQIQQRLSTLHIGNRGDATETDASVSDDSNANASAVSAPEAEWTIRKCIINRYFAKRSLYADEELSTSSEGSEKLSSD